MTISANENDPRGMEVEVLECDDLFDTWLVEAIDTGSEGEVYQTFFAGPKAKERALAYAATSYGHTA